MSSLTSLLRQLDWRVTAGIASMHILAIGCAMPFTWTWGAITWFVVCTLTSGLIGINLCYHRLLTHRSFRTYTWCEYLLTACGCTAWQGGPCSWVGIHRLHHAHADADNDPHTPNHGFTWSHIGWMLWKTEAGRDPQEVTKDLQRDQGLRFLDRYFYIPQLLLACCALTSGWLLYGWKTGVGWLVWGIGFRTVLVYHATWFVNSAAHTWGYRHYATKDGSKNLWWVALLSFGEGWHNNHHENDRAANHGRRWWEIDPTFRLIQFLALLGLAWDIKRA